MAAISRRYSRALDAKPSKGPMTADGVAAITDSVADVPELLREVERLMLADTYDPEGAAIVLRQLHDCRQLVVELQDLLAEQRRRADALEVR